MGDASAPPPMARQASAPGERELPAVLIRRLLPSDDEDAIVRLWREGFQEMAPHAARRMRQGATTALVGGLLAALAYAAGLRRTAYVLAAGSLALYVPPLGEGFVNSYMYLVIALLARTTMHGLNRRWGEDRDPPSAFYVATLPRSNTIVGIGAVKLAHTLYGERQRGVAAVPREASIWRLAVTPAVRRLGVARQIMAKLEGFAAARGCTHASLVTGNPESQAFYRKLGYATETEERARRVLFGTSGQPAGLFGALKLVMLRRRLGAMGSVMARRIAGADDADGGRQAG